MHIVFGVAGGILLAYFILANLEAIARLLGWLFLIGLIVGLIVCAFIAYFVGVHIAAKAGLPWLIGFAVVVWVPLILAMRRWERWERRRKCLQAEREEAWIHSMHSQMADAWIQMHPQMTDENVDEYVSWLDDDYFDVTIRQLRATATSPTR
jgi:hypothetical protein